MNADGQFVQFKALVGFESVFPDHWEDDTFDFGRDEQYRQRRIEEFVELITVDNRDEWYSFIERCAATKTRRQVVSRSNVQAIQSSSCAILCRTLFVMDALIVNIVCLSLPVGIFQVVVGLPLLFLKQDRRQRLRNIGIFLGVLVMVAVSLINAFSESSPSCRYLPLLPRICGICPPGFQSR